MKLLGSGKLVKCSEGYAAFIPNPLPPAIEWNQRLINTLSEADRLLGRLAGEGGKLPNPHLFIRPFIVREAVLSSRIEGTQATLGEILAVNAGATVERNPDDLREVSGYIAALEYGIARLNSLPLSLRLLREMHEKLMQCVRGHHTYPGEFRRSQNWIGSSGCTLATATYVPPPPDQLIECLGDLEKFLQEDFLPPLVQIALAHYQFEAIHPFLDGNGRVGRLLITLFLLKKEILPTPLLYLSAFFEATRQEYYSRLLAVSQRGEWENWLFYFLTGIIQQSKDALARAERMNRLLDQWKHQVAGLSSRIPYRLVERLASNPFITIKKATEQEGASYTALQRAMEKLINLKIIKEISGGKRNRVYCANDILAILEEPAKLS